jgi:hypothetical protein
VRASQPKRVYRSSEQAILIALTGLIGTGAIAVETLALSRPWGGHIGYLLFAAALGYFYLFRAARSGVYIEADGIRILNPFRSVRVPWKEIRYFSLKRYGLFPLTGHAELKDGTSIHVFGIQGPNRLLRPNSRGAQRIIEALNARLDEVRQRPAVT